MTDFIGILRILKKHQVDFFVTGGVSAVFHGAPITTFDLDIVHDCSPENVDNLIQALRELETFYRTRQDQRIFPEMKDLVGNGHHLLMTKFGPLDVLGSIGRGKTFGDLISDTEVIDLGGHSIHVHNLKSLIDIKELIGRDKDKAVLPILRKTLEEGKK